MLSLQRAVAAFTLLLATLVCAAQGDPLFLSDDPLEITIEMPMNTLIRNAESKPEIPGILRLRGNDGQTVSIEMTMTTRGRSRLDYCRFPPLKVNLKKGQTDGTVLAGQNKIKIVTHCRDGDLHERYLRQEFGIYKTYNALTDFSYRARWLTVIYVDSDGKRDKETRPAFFIESNRELAARHGRERATENRIPSGNLNPVETSKYAMFQLLIANTDWSMLKGPGDEGCCHNGKILLKPGTTNDWVVVPYDFDQAGIISTKYAAPAPALRIRSVRQRLYRGRCRHNSEVDSTIALFNAKRAEIEKHLVPQEMSDSMRSRLSKYVDAFYEIVNDPKKHQKQIIEKCLGA